MTAPPASAAARRFALALYVVAAFAVLGSLRTFLGEAQNFPWLLLLSVPVVAAVCRYPLWLDTKSGTIEIGLDCAVLVFLAGQASAEAATLIWVIATVIVQMTMHKSLRSRLFNTALCSLAGLLALQVMSLIDPLTTSSPRELLGVAAGCIVYFAVDFVVTGVYLALLSGNGLRHALLDPSVPLAMAAFLGVCALGYVATVLWRNDRFALPLVAPPMLGLMFAVRAFSRAHEDRGRLRSMFEGARTLLSAGSPDQIEAATIAWASRVLRSQSAELLSAPPSQERLVEVLPGCEPAQWLAVAPTVTGTPWTDDDRDALRTMATVAASALHKSRLDSQMLRLARHDALTGLPNRTVFRERVTHTLNLRSRDGRGLGVLFCDLDGFKGVNDTLGHEAGDELLIALAARLRGELRPGDSIARLGGDEFAILMEEAAGPDDVLQVGRRILAAVRRPVRIRGREVALGASVGGVLGNGTEDVGELLRCSDVAMYHVKTSGKNGVALFSPQMLSDRLDRVQLEIDLEEAVTGDQLRLHYQPLVDLRTGRIEGFEALVRWAHPTRGLLAPSAFIDVAEETGAIDLIGAWVLGRALSDGCEFVQMAQRPLSMAVNVSGRQLRGELLEPLVADQARRCAELSLVLELTEGTLVEAASSVSTLDRLRGYGLEIAVDDFGTGYSSIAYLRTLPVDTLKIDRSLVADCADDERAAGVVAAVLQMAASLDLDVVAEGIESTRQENALRRLGCALGQGYLYSRPVPAAQVPRLLARPVSVEPAVVGGAALIA